MMSYGQLIKIKGTTRKRFWYICGSDSALIQDAIEIAKAHVYSGVTSVFLEVFFGSDETEKDLLEFFETPCFDERKLAIVYECEKIPDWEQIIEELESTSSSTFAMFVTSKAPEANHSCNKLFTNNRFGRAVKCTSLKSDAVKQWVHSRISISDTALNNLLSKYNNDNEWLLNKVRILEYLDVPEITSKIIDRITTDMGIDNFEDSIIKFDKQQCFLYIKDRGTSRIDLSRIISETHNLALLQTIVGQYSKQKRPLEDITGLTRTQIDSYMDKLSYYDLTTSSRCFKAITQLYPKLMQNDESAFLALVCRW